ncbi:MAG TPA: alpha/beta fold hydrolase [Streptosporangiaceae bacterium]|nr:alpha/beta fold hydrolase [Streptosporangiaceae bacterium]
MLIRPARRPDLVVRYGAEPDQVADVHVPPEDARLAEGTGPRAMFTIFLHGGFWRSEYGREHTAPLAEALAEAGFVVCAPEYRRSGQRGGGWPGTFDDVAAAVDRLPELVARATGELVDERRYVLAGHSAGGHLALWAASRHRLPAGSPWRPGVAGAGAAAGSLAGVVALAPVSDLTACYRLGLGEDAAGALMGGGPAQVPERYAAADPARLLPAGGGGRVVLVHGDADDRVPCSMSVDYAARARAAGDMRTECSVLRGAGHFAVIDPLSEAWPEVLAAFSDAGRGAL